MMMIGLWTEEKNKKKGGRWYNDLELDISNNCSIDATAKSCVDRLLRDNFFYDIFRPRVVFPCSILGKRLSSLWTISLSPKTSAESIETPRKEHLDEVQQSLEWPNFAFFTPTQSSRKVTRLTQLTKFRPKIISVVCLQLILTKKADRDSGEPAVGLILE